MEFVGLGIGILDLLRRQFYYLKNVEQLSETLHVNMDELSALKTDIKIEVNWRTENSKMKLKNGVQLWLKKVDKITNEEDGTENEISKKGKCMKGCFPNCYSRYKLGKLLRGKSKEVNELKVKRNGLFVSLLPDAGKILPMTTMIGSRTPRKVSSEIWECLADISINKIGLYQDL